MKLGIMTIATNRYIEYFEDLVDSFLEFFPESKDTQWFLFTDQIEEANRIAAKNKKIKIVVISIPSYKFPEATLYRYEIYNSHKNILDSEILMHLDADMLVKSPDFLGEVFKPGSLRRISLVQHPGFYRPHGIGLINFYARNPIFFIRDLLTKVEFGALGAWERNECSRAYVSRRSRKTYVCGGIWFGPNELIKAMIETLAINVKKDESRNVTAIWHDESHLNSFSTKSDVGIHPPEFCFDPTYKNLAGLRQLVEAVDKNG
jgi:hypothetical protein